MLRYFWGSIAFSAACLAVGAWLGWATTHDLAGMLGVVWIILILGALETSLSFDNAVVNATVLRGMDAAWRRRFLTWGIVLAVFGTRILFPLAIVAVAGGLGPVAAARLALTDPAGYAQIITDAHTGVMGFGGAFLAAVGLDFFLDEDKHEHWFGPVERRAVRLARVPGVAVAVVLLALYGVSRTLEVGAAATFLGAGVLGLVTHAAVQALGVLLGGEDAAEGAAAGTARSGLAAFLYLEVLDASFSFDGVIGSFALTDDLLVIALGLGIGAVFVRSLTVLMVERGTLARFRYLEHGAFYAIVALAGIMLASVRVKVPETVTGLVGVALIGAAVVASLRAERRDRRAAG